MMATLTQVKVRLSCSKKFVLVYFNGSSLKVIKNAFHFMLTALFVLEIFVFSYWRFDYLEKCLDKMLWLILKIMTSQTGQEIITIHLLPNISRSKGNQIMRFGQLKECNNIFLEKSYKQCDGETSFRPFYLELVSLPHCLHDFCKI